jgi:hypothetical protein
MWKKLEPDFSPNPLLNLLYKISKKKSTDFYLKCFVFLLKDIRRVRREEGPPNIPKKKTNSKKTEHILLPYMKNK